MKPLNDSPLKLCGPVPPFFFACYELREEKEGELVGKGRAEGWIDKIKCLLTCTGMRAPRRPSIWVLVNRMEEEEEEEGEEEGVEGAGERGTKAWRVVLDRRRRQRLRNDDSVLMLLCGFGLAVCVWWKGLIRYRGTETRRHDDDDKATARCVDNKRLPFNHIPAYTGKDRDVSILNRPRTKGTRKREG